MNKRELIEWTIYRITESQCCVNCKHLKEKTCPKRINIKNFPEDWMEEVKQRCKDDKYPLSLYGSKCEDWK